MATYLELFGLRRDSDLNNKVAVAVVKKAQSLLDGATPTANELTWADKALKNPESIGGEILNYVLAANSSVSVATIQAATDATIQANVDSAVDALIAGGVV